MRVKTGFTRKRKHLKVISRTKGFRMTKGRLYKVSKEADLHAGQYAFAGRKLRKRQFRRLWITRLGAALKEFDLSYSGFANKLQEKNIKLNRKVLSELAINQPKVFTEIANLAKS